MITKFKIFENNNKPQIGDYVVCQDLSKTNHNNTNYKLFSNLITNNVGQIVGTGETHEFFVSYEDVPVLYDILSYAFFTTDRLIIKNLEYKPIIFGKDKYTNITSFKLEEIVFFSNNKETVENFIEIKQNANKYNL